MDKLDELQTRRNLVQMGKAVLNDADQDPRYPDAMAELNRQLGEIDQQIAAITGSPPSVTVGLKSASLFSKVINL